MEGVTEKRKMGVEWLVMTLTGVVECYGGWVGVMNWWRNSVMVVVFEWIIECGVKWLVMLLEWWSAMEKVD